LLQRSEELIVLGVRADPEPNGGLAVDERERAVSEPDAGSVDRLTRMHLFEMKARMVWVVREAPIGLTGTALDVLG
jgi:hypothetical protein